MSQLPNPNSSNPYERVIKDQNGEELYGIRNEHTPEEEIVHIPTSRSNQQYWQPEKVLDPTGCKHTFQITSVSKREIECSKCHFETTIHLGINYTEVKGKGYIVLNDKKYPLKLQAL
jgi:hypothetical protein